MAAKKGKGKSVSLERLEQILPAAYDNYKKLVPALELMIHYRIETLEQLHRIASELEKRRRGGNVVKLAASIAGVTGTAIATAGVALTPATLGAGLLIFAGGSAVAVVGSLAAAGAHVTEKVCEKIDLEKVQQAIDRDKKQCEVVKELWKEFESYCDDAINTIALADPSRESDISSVQTWAQVALETVKHPIVLIAETLQEFLSSPAEEDSTDGCACVSGDVLCGVLGAVAQAIISNPERIFRSVVSKLRVNMGVVVGTLAFVLITTVFLVSFFGLFVTIVDVKKGSPSEVAKDLRIKSSKLQKELDGWLDAFGKPISS